MSHDFDDELERSSTERRRQTQPTQWGYGSRCSSGAEQEGGYASRAGALESRQEKTPGWQQKAELDFVMGDSPYPSDPEAAKAGGARETSSREQWGRGGGGGGGGGVKNRMWRKQCSARKPQCSRAVRESKQRAGHDGGNGRRQQPFLISDRARQRKSADAAIIAIVVAECSALVAIFSDAFMARIDVTDPTLGRSLRSAESRQNGHCDGSEENMKRATGPLPFFGCGCP